MDDTPFSVASEAGIAHLRFTRPQSANAMGATFWRDFPKAVRALDEAGQTRALIISGEGRHFCSGMDVSAFGGAGLRPDDGPGQRDAFVATVRRLQQALSCLAEARFPVIAAIQGACIGGALDLVSACDLRFVSPDAYFRIEEINIGMMADIGSLQRLPRLLPDAILRHMAFCGMTLRPDQALSLGFVNGVSEAPLDAAMDAAREIARRAPLAISGSKRAIGFAREHTVAESLEQVAWLQAAIWSTGDVMGAIQARGEKRDGVFEPLQAFTGLGL